MLKCHDMTSWHDVKVHVMARNDIITSSAPSSISWILFLFLREPTLITKTPKWFQAKQWRHDITMTSCHDVLNTDYFTTLLSLEVDVIEQRFFLFLRFFGSRKSMACRSDTWPWSVTLYVKVTWSFKWPILSQALYMLETWFFLFPWFVGSRKSMACRSDKWPWRVTLYVKFTWSYKWPILSQALYMLETWFFCVFFCLHGLLAQGSQWHVGQIRDSDAWPRTLRSRDLTSDLSYLRPYTC